MTTYYRERRPVRDLRAYTRRQALQEAHVTLNQEAEYDIEEDESYYTTRLPTSSRRYQGYSVSPEEVYTSGNTRYHVRYVDVPKRKSRQAQLPSPEREVDTGEIEQ